jgi:uncharacterized membrane protein
LAVVNYYAFNYHTWDTASFANSLSNGVLSGHFYNTFLDRPALADHFYPNLFAFYPFFAIEQSVLWLVVAKIIAYLWTALLLVRTGRLLGITGWALYIFPIVFLLHNYTMNTLLFEFQPSSLALPFIVISFNLAIQKKYWILIFPLLFLLGFKEHMALIWIVVGTYIFLINHDRAIGLAYCVSGFFWGALIFFVVMPYFSEGLGSLHASRFNPFSLLYNKFSLLALSMLSVSLLPIFDYRAMFFIFPAFGISLVSNNLNMVGLEHHYHDIAMPVLFIGAMLGFIRLRFLCRYCSRMLKGFLITIFILIFFIMNASIPGQRIRQIWPDSYAMEIFFEAKRLSSVIQSGVPIWVTERFSTFLLDHPQLKSIDVWFGIDGAINSVGPKVVVFPKNMNLASLNPDLYGALLQKVEIDVTSGLAFRHNDFQHFLIYEYK